MTSTALSEIRTLRGGRSFEIDPCNRNRYRVLLKENTGTTAYCFSTPIYNLNNRKLVFCRFDKSGDAFLFTGSNATVTAYKGQIVLKNTEGIASIRLFPKDFTLRDGMLCTEGWEIRPTLNGISVRVKRPSVVLKISTDKTFCGVRYNPKSFAVMQEEFRPFLTLSPLLATDNSGIFLSGRGLIPTDRGTHL